MLKKANLAASDLGVRPLSDVAGTILRERLEAVCKHIPPATDAWHETPEHVHQLRVATRRASAAIRSFAKTVPSKRAKRLQRALSRLRRSVGKARDLDVMRFEIEKRSNNQRNKPKNVLAEIKRQRKKSQRRLIEQRTWLEAWGLAGRIEELVQRVRWRGKSTEPTFAHEAHRMLGEAAKRVRVAADHDLQETKTLHALRIAGKRLRYTLELVEGVIQPQQYQDLTQQMKSLQDRLGKINDHAAASARLRTWVRKTSDKHTRSQLSKLARREKKALKRDQQRFFDWWQRDGQESVAAILRLIESKQLVDLA